MMFKFIVICTLYTVGLSPILFAQEQNLNRENIANNINTLITKILADEKLYEKTSTLLVQSNKKIVKNRKKINSMKKQKVSLEKELKKLKIDQDAVEENIIKLIKKRYSKSLAIKYADKRSTKSVVDEQVYTILLNSIKVEVVQYNKVTDKLNKKLSGILRLIEKLTLVQSKQKELSRNNRKLQQEQKENLKELRKKHKLYIAKLKAAKKKEAEMKTLLTNLDIVEKTEPVKKDIAKKNVVKKKEFSPASQDFESTINDISNASLSIPLNNQYNGLKTIAPLKNYTITQKFGKYYDAVYQAELFNKSIILNASSPNNRVINMLEGEVVFIKRNMGKMKNMIIVEHLNGLNIIYSNLDSVSSIISVGQTVPKRYILGTVGEELVLQATQDNKYVDPEKLFN